MLAAMAVAAGALAQPKFSHPDRIRYDGQCFTIDGTDTFVFSGAFHYFRCPQALWRERFQRIKEAGFNTVETYVAWNWHERSKPSGLDDFSKVNLKELDAWLTMAEKEFGLYTIVRPGPYICSEWAAGGYPSWLPAFRPAKTTRPVWYRSDDPVYLSWCKHWYDAVARVVTKHQLTRKPVGEKGVILWQVENEYSWGNQPEDAKRGQLRALVRFTLDAGIDVPIFTCWTPEIRDPQGDPLLSQVFDTPNAYPRWDIGILKDYLNDQHKAHPWAPKMVTELQGGWFGNVGGLAAEEQDGVSAAQINALTLYTIQNGLTSLNYYMLFGGTNFGDWAGQNITTCYDYFSPLREWGGVGEKFRAVKAIGAMLKEYGPDLARSVEATTDLKSDTPEVQVAARMGKDGATYLFVRNSLRDRPMSGTLGGALKVELGPFGMNVYRYTDSLKDGKWIVKPIAPPVATPLPAPVRIDTAEAAVLEPTGWKEAPKRSTILNLGVHDSRFVFYRASVPQGPERYLWLTTEGGEVLSDAWSAPGAYRGGKAYRTSGGELTFLLLNPGWPNGGAEMEAGRGVSEARLLDELPVGVALKEWKGKTISDPDDRSLTGEGVDDSTWAAADLSAPSWSTMVFRASFDAGENPKKDAVLTFGCIDDHGWVYVNGQFVGEAHDWSHAQTFPIGKVLRPGKNVVAVVVRNNEGGGGLTSAVTIDAPLPDGEPVVWQWTDAVKDGAYSPYRLDTSAALARNERPKPSGGRPGGARLVRSRVRFAAPKASAAVAWEIVLQAGGDGFLTLNGRALGRYWEVGPQRAYYLPSCWLKKQNVLELTVVPGPLGDRITAAELRPLPMEQ